MTTEPNGLLASTNARLAALEERGAERVKEVAALKDENRRLADALADSEVQLAASQARVAEMDPTDGRTRCMKCHAVIVGSLDSIFPWWCSAKCRDACDIHRAHMLAVAERNSAREEARRLQQQFASGVRAHHRPRERATEQPGDCRRGDHGDAQPS
jgi:hypothetical protein